MIHTLWLKRLLYVFLGAAAGYAYYFFIGCVTGSCPITSNPFYSTGYGALVGLIMTIGTPRRKSR